MNRALNGTPKPIWRNGQEVGSVRQFDNRLLQFLLKAHRPDLYGDRGKAAAPSLPFDLVKRMADAEARLAELIGEPSGRLHTARSRNDQVATDFRLWVRAAIGQIDTGLRAFQSTLVMRADEHAESIMPGFTVTAPNSIGTSI